MELFDALIMTVVLGAATPFIAVLARTLLGAIATVIVVREQAQVSSLDRILAEMGWCTARTLSPGRPPAEGCHFLFLRGPVVALRTRATSARGDERSAYELYTFGAAAAQAVSARLSGDPRDITLRYVYAPAPWRTCTVTTRAAPPPRAHPWQDQVIRQIESAFATNGRASALVCGAPGLGKSTLGELLADALQSRSRLAAEVVKNLDLTARGLLLEDVYDTPVPNSPVILVLDEFDAAVEYAERAERGDGEAAALAETPTVLLTLLDRLGRTPHLIVLATSNRPLSEMTTGRFARYTRAGRLDLHTEAAPANN